MVDDDPIFNYLNKEIIDMIGLGQNIISYCDSTKAIDFLRRIVKMDKAKFPEIIFLDINMPIMDGWQFLDSLANFPRSILIKCKVFMVSSSISAKDMARSKTFKMVKGFISKPLTTETLELLFPAMHVEA